MANLQKRITQLEHRASGPVLIVVWNEDKPDTYTAEGNEYPNLAGVEAANPGRELVVMRIVYDAKKVEL